MKWAITVTTPEELAKAEIDPSYSPADRVVARFEADTMKYAADQFASLCRQHPEWVAPTVICEVDK